MGWFTGNTEQIATTPIGNIPLYNEQKMEEVANDAPIIEPTEEESKSLGEMAFNQLGVAMMFTGAVGAAMVIIAAISTWLGLSAIVVVVILFVAGLLFYGISKLITILSNPLGALVK